MELHVSLCALSTCILQYPITVHVSCNNLYVEIIVYIVCLLLFSYSDYPLLIQTVKETIRTYKNVYRLW